MSHKTVIPYLYLLYVRIYISLYTFVILESQWSYFLCREKRDLPAPTMCLSTLVWGQINEKAYTFLSHSLSCRNTTARGNYIFWVMEMLCHGISHQALCRGWSTLSLLTARWAIVKGLSMLGHLCDPLWHSCVCAFLTSFPRKPHASTQHSKHLPQPPKHLLSTRPGRRVSSIIMHSTTQHTLMAVAHWLVV